MKYNRLLAALGLGLAAVLGVCLLEAGEQEGGPADSRWLDRYFEQVLPACEMDFPLSTAFSYREDGGKAVLLYATTAEVDAIRTHYIDTYAAKTVGRNDETALSLDLALDQGTARIVNYYSPVSRVVELELTLTKEEADRLSAPVEEAFPQAALVAALEGTGLSLGAVSGSYVRYTYDELSPYYRKGVPIFSRAVAADEAALTAAVDVLKGRHEQYTYSEAEHTHYVQTEHGILALAPLGDGRVAVSLQSSNSKV